MSVKAVIPAFFGISGPELNEQERDFFCAVRPAGYILFARNCVSADQIKALTDTLRGLDGNDALPILIDQEGGRVARLRPPQWHAHPPARLYGDLWRQDKAAGYRALALGVKVIAGELTALGITVDCLPVLDIPSGDADPIIGDRAYGQDVDAVSHLGLAAMNTLIEGGVVPIIKHIPGHGRAVVDSHLALPVVSTTYDDLCVQDFAPFKALAHAPMAMTAHVVYEAVDAQNCATLSPYLIRNIIRKEIGFKGLLMSDDVSMQALEGAIEERAQSALMAGCDIILHCNGHLDEMRAIANTLPSIGKESMERLENAMAIPRLGEVPTPEVLQDWVVERNTLLNWHH